jgi:hypothetical protein
MEIRHCRYIHLQADQNPNVTPTNSKAALQKMPLPNV